MVRYRRSDGRFADATLVRLPADDVLAGLPVREFRSYHGQRHYSGWYWSSTGQRMVAYESRLELARIMLTDFEPGVTAIAAQPVQPAGPDGPRMRRPRESPPAGHGRPRSPTRSPAYEPSHPADQPKPSLPPARKETCRFSSFLAVVISPTWAFASLLTDLSPGFSHRPVVFFTCPGGLARPEANAPINGRAAASSDVLTHMGDAGATWASHHLKKRQLRREATRQPGPVESRPPGATAGPAD
jgi:hypothetical protein